MKIATPIESYDCQSGLNLDMAMSRIGYYKQFKRKENKINLGLLALIEEVSTYDEIDFMTEDEYIEMIKE